MCLISFSWQPSSHTPLTLVANRDEFHARPAQTAQFWRDYPHLLAGKDLTGGGTWLGVTKQGFFAALTNVRQLPAPYEGQVSRGNLVLNYLIHQPDPKSYLDEVAQDAARYDGFNLIVGNREALWFYNNRHNQGPLAISAGTYGISNGTLDTPWPKLETAKRDLGDWLKQPSQPLHTLLDKRQTYDKHLLPSTGISEEWESMLSAAFITSNEYGTRASTGLQIHQDGIDFTEASYDSQGNETNLATFHF